MMRSLILSLIFLPLATMAQDLDDMVEQPEIRRYTVEIIIFRYSQDVSAGSEVFLPDEPEPEELLPIEDLLPEADLPEEPSEPEEALLEPEEEPEPLPGSELVLLDEEDYQLGDAMVQLNRLDAYEPLMHVGWTQAVWPEEETEAVSLFRLGMPPEGLDGSLTLYLSRFLHLVVDVQLRDPDSIENPITSTDDGFASFSDEVIAPRPIFYRIQEDRIVKNNDLRYYDHPRFGVLARVTRVEDDEEENPAEGELLGYPSE
jgi:hypothetical protein